MSTTEIVRKLDSLFKALDGPSIFPGPCNYAARIVRSMLDAVSGNAVPKSNSRDADTMTLTSNGPKDRRSTKYTVQDLGVGQAPSLTQKELCRVLSRFCLFVELFVAKELPHKKGRKFSNTFFGKNKASESKQDASKLDRKKLVHHAWCLAHLDVLHTRFCAFLVNTYVLFLNAYDHSSALNNQKVLLMFPKDLLTIVAMRDKRDESFKKECNKVAHKISKQNILSTGSSARGAFVVKLTGAFYDEYFTKESHLSPEQLLDGVKRFTLLSAPDEGILLHHLFSYKNYEFLSGIVSELQAKSLKSLSNMRMLTFESLISSNKAFKQFAVGTKSSSFFLVKPSADYLCLKNTKLHGSKGRPEDASDGKPASSGLFVVTCVKISSTDAFVALKEIDFISTQVGASIELEKNRGHVMFPMAFSPSFSYGPERIFMFYENVKCTLAQLMFKEKNGIDRFYNFNEYEVLAIFLSISKGLEYIADLGCCLGTLSPKNIAFCPHEDGVFKLKIMISESITTPTRAAAVDTSFLDLVMKSPESLVSQVDVRIDSDIFSLGMIIFLLLHCGMTLEALAQSVVNTNNSSTTLPSTTLASRWSTGIAAGNKPEIEKDEFFVDRPLRLELLYVLGKCWCTNMIDRISPTSLSEKLVDILPGHMHSNDELDSVISKIIENADTNDFKSSQNTEMNEKFKKLNLQRNRHSVVIGRDERIDTEVSVKDIGNKGEIERSSSKGMLKSFKSQHADPNSKKRQTYFNLRGSKRGGRASNNGPGKHRSKRLSLGSTKTNTSRSSRKPKQRRFSQLQKDGASKSFLYRVRKNVGGTMNRTRSRRKNSEERKSRMSINIEDIGENKDLTQTNGSFSDETMFHEALDKFGDTEQQSLSMRFREQKELQEILSEVDNAVPEMEKPKSSPPPKPIRKKGKKRLGKLFKDTDPNMKIED